MHDRLFSPTRGENSRPRTRTPNSLPLLVSHLRPPFYTKHFSILSFSSSSVFYISSPISGQNPEEFLTRLPSNSLSLLFFNISFLLLHRMVLQPQLPISIHHPSVFPSLYSSSPRPHFHYHDPESLPSRHLDYVPRSFTSPGLRAAICHQSATMSTLFLAARAFLS